MAFVAGGSDHFAIEDDGGGEADGFLAHPAHGLERLERQAGEVGGGVGVGHGVIHNDHTLFPVFAFVND